MGVAALRTLRHVRYFAWKSGPLSDGWRRHHQQCAFFAQEQICDAAFALQRQERAAYDQLRE